MALAALLVCPYAALAQWGPNGAPVCIAPGSQDIPVAVSDGHDGVFVAWRDYRDLTTTDADVYVQHVRADGTLPPGWPLEGVAVCRAPQPQYAVALAADGAGGVILAWEDARDVFSTGWNIYAQHVTAAGDVAPGWPVDGLTLCTARDDQVNPAMVADGAGGAIILWEDYRDGNHNSQVNSDIYGVRIDGAGRVVSGWPAQGLPVCNEPSNQTSVVAMPDGSGGVIAAWIDDRNLNADPYGRNSDIYAVRLQGDGTGAPGAWVANGEPMCRAPGLQQVLGPDGMCTDGAGGALVVWTDYRTQNGDSRSYYYADIYAQHVLVDGSLAPGWPVDGVAACDVFFLQAGPQIAPDGAGGCVIAWYDLRDVVSHVYAVRLQGSGAVAPGWPANGRRVNSADTFQCIPRMAGDGGAAPSSLSTKGRIATG